MAKLFTDIRDGKPELLLAVGSIYQILSERDKYRSKGKKVKIVDY